MADDKSKQPIIIKKKKGGHAGAHGGAWKIAYADFVTAMMAFFLVMWIVGMAEESKHGIAEYFQNLTARATHEPASPHLVHLSGAPPVRPNPAPIAPKDNNFDQQQGKLLASKVESLLGSSLQFERLRPGITAAAEANLSRIIMADTADSSLFIDNGATLKPEAKRFIEGVAAILANYRCRIVLEGHSDGRPAAPPVGSSWDRSANRAIAIRTALAAGGIDDSRVVVVSAYADTQLSTKGDPMNPGNRRVVVLIPYDMPE